MKKALLTISLFILTFYFSTSQTYNIASYNGQTVTACSGYFTSSDACLNYNWQYGYFDGYCAGEDYTITFYSGDPQKRMSILFSEFIRDTGDELYAYDGPNTSSTLIHKLTLTNLTYAVKSSGSYITFRFISSSSSAGGAWSATIACEYIPTPPSLCNGNSPAANSCSNAPHICNLNGYCGNTSDYFTSDLPGNMCESCSLFSGTMQNNSWLSFTADTTSATLEVSVLDCSKSMGLQLGIYAGTGCNSFQLLSDPGYTSGSAGYNNANTTFTVKVPYTGAPNLVKGKDYYVMVDGMGGDVCNYTIKALTGIFAVSAGPDQTICQGQSAIMKATGGKTYHWSPSYGLSSVSLANPVASPTITTTYTVSFTGGSVECPQTNTDVVVVYVNPNPKVSINADKTTICSGSSVNLQASGANTYKWSPVSGLTSSSIANPVAKPTVTTTYTVTGTNTLNGISCSANNSITINVNPSPVITIAPKSICKGNTTDINASASGSNGPFNYKWNTGETSAAINVSPQTNTTYSVTVTDQSSGCFATGSTTVTVSNSVTISFTPQNPSICNGKSVTINAAGADTYIWNNNLTGSSITVTPNKTTIYTVTGTNAGNCFGTNTITVTVNPVPDAVITPMSSTTFCPGGSVVLNASTGNGYTYQWKKNDNIMSGSSGSSLTASSAGNYSVVITGPGNCSSTSNPVTVTVSKPEANILPSGPVEICRGNSVTLNANTGIGLTYQWLNSNTVINGATQNSFRVTNSGSYTVVVSSSVDCSSTSNTVEIGIRELPPATATTNGTNTLCKGGTITLSANGSDYSYQWKDINGIINGATNSTYNASKEGTYIVIVSDGVCSNTSNPVSINLSNLSVNLQYNTDTLCLNDSVFVSAAAHNGSEPYSYVWNPENTNNTVKIKNTNASDNISSSNVMVIVTDNIGCKSKDSVTIFEMPELKKIAAITPDEGFSPLTVNFIYNGGNGEVIWWFGDNSQKDQNAITSHNYIYDPSKDKTGSGKVSYYAKIIVNQCLDSVEIIVKAPFINKIPDLFSPNNDGQNDYFVAEANGIESADIKIFDRWGIKVYSKSLNSSDFIFDKSAGSSEGDYKYYILWDGTNNNGSKVASGVYFYIISPKSKDGKTLEPKEGKLTGTVTLLK